MDRTVVVGRYGIRVVRVGAAEFDLRVGRRHWRRDAFR